MASQIIDFPLLDSRFDCIELIWIIERFSFRSQDGENRATLSGNNKSKNPIEIIKTYCFTNFWFVRILASSLKHSHKSFEDEYMSLINTEVKAFNATAYQNGEFIELSEQNLKGTWSVVFFYPADFTFVCPTELGDLADHYAEFQKLGVEIYGVSTDTHFTHKAWHDTSDVIGKIQYPLIGDPTWTLSKNFDVLIETEGLADRGTFVIDPEGKIQIIEINAGGIGRDASELLRKVKAAQYVHAHPGEVCPAKWKEGEATLAPSIDLVGKI